MADLLFKRSWTDVIFLGKNQEYGAYELRKDYNKNINKALIIAVVVFSTLISIPVILTIINAGKVEEEENVTVNLELLPPPPVDPNTPPPPPPPKIELPKLAAAIKFLPPKVEDDEKVQEDPPTIDDMKDKVISTENIKGEEGIDNMIEEPAPAQVIEDAREEVFLVVEEMPEFPGGNGAMMKYIASNIKYPRIASQQGLEGRVIVTFVINGQGEVSNVDVIKGIGGGCDEEALRVIKSLPKWKAGRQNGRPVSVKFTVPIKFALN